MPKYSDIWRTWTMWVPMDLFLYIISGIPISNAYDIRRTDTTRRTVYHSAVSIRYSYRHTEFFPYSFLFPLCHSNVFLLFLLIFLFGRYKCFFLYYIYYDFLYFFYYGYIWRIDLFCYRRRLRYYVS